MSNFGRTGSGLDIFSWKASRKFSTIPFVYILRQMMLMVKKAKVVLAANSSITI